MKYIAYEKDGMAKKKVTFMLCHGRHKVLLSCHGSIYEHKLPSIMAIGALEQIAYSKLKILHSIGIDHIDLIVTGASTALASVINAMQAVPVSVTLLHYNAETNSYVRQPILINTKNNPDV